MRDTREEHYFLVFFRLFARLPLAYTEAPLSFAFLRRSELREPCEILTRETIYIRVFLFLLFRCPPLGHISLLAFSILLALLASNCYK